MPYDIIRYGDPVKATKEAMEKSNIEIAMAVTAQAKLLAPVAVVNGGRLRNSINWVAAGGEKGGLNDGGGEKALKGIALKLRQYDAAVGSALDYAIYQEFGTRRMIPQPYLRPAIDIIVGKKDPQKIIKELNNIEMKRETKSGSKKIKRFK